MSFEEFVRYAKILIDNGVQGIILSGGGEPTISKDFDKIVRWLEDNNIEYGINTNFNVLKYIKPKYLKISLDGYDNESYISKRGVDKYDTVISNLKKYLKWKKENNVNTDVGIQIVADNLEQVQKFYEAHKDLEVDYFNIRPVESTHSDYYNDTNAIYRKNEIVDWLNEQIKKDKRICINYKWFEIHHSFSKCYGNFLQIALNHKGEVMYCCHKPYEIIGHITDVDIWDKRIKATTNMSKCDTPCRLSASNSLIEKIEKGCKESAFI